MINSKQLFSSWLWLLILTLFAVAIGRYFHGVNESSGVFIFCVMAIVALKGQQIVDVFMELKHAPKHWRYLLLSYIIIVPLVITLIYL